MYTYNSTIETIKTFNYLTSFLCLYRYKSVGCPCSDKNHNTYLPKKAKTSEFDTLKLLKHLSLFKNYSFYPSEY